MPGGILVIGVGGVGRGIVNHLKWRLEDRYGSPEKAGVCLYVIDGPIQDGLSEVPGGYQINVSPGSPEKYTFNSNPQDSLIAIEKGENVPFVSEWLSKETAKNVPKVGVAPEQGFGGSRIAGRTTFFLDADRINVEVGRLLTATGAFFDTARNIGQFAAEEGAVGGSPAPVAAVFICGSQSGGTGAGLLTDVACMVKSQLPNRLQSAKLYGVLALPGAFMTFKQGDEQERLVANGIAGLREIRRMQNRKVPFEIKYSDALTVSSKQLFELCYLIDGGPVYSGANPQLYMYPSAADMIFAHVEDRNAIYVRNVDRIANIATVGAGASFSRYAVHDLFCAQKDLVRVLGLRFAEDILARLTASGGGNNNGGDAANESLRKNAFTEYALSGTWNLAPPSPRHSAWNTLGQKIGQYPQLPDLTSAIPMAGAFFVSGNTNQVVERNTTSLMDRYLGENVENPAPNSMSVWLQNREPILCAEIEDKLIRGIVDLFYDKKEGSANLVPKSWAVQGQLSAAVEYAERVKGVLERFKRAVDEAWRDALGHDGNPPSARCRTAMNAAFAGVPKTKADRAKQTAYLSKGNEYLKARLWEMFIKSAQRVLERLILVTDRLLGKLGTSAGGWIKTLEDHTKEARDRRAEINTARRAMSEISTRTMLPVPEGNDEDQLYRREVAAAHIDNYLSASSWMLGLEGGADRLATVEGFFIYAVTPSTPGYRGNEIRVRNFARFHSNAPAADEVFTEFSWQQMEAYAVHKVVPALGKLTLWDMMALDFEANFKNRSEIRELSITEQIDRYVAEKCNSLVAGGKNNLQLKTDTPGRVQNYSWAMSAFQSVSAPSSNAERIATAFHDSLKERNMPLVTVPHMRNRCVLLTVDDGLAADDWQGLADCRKIYERRLSDTSKPSPTVFPHERTAIPIEAEIARKERQSICRWLSPELTALLGDRYAFEDFVLAYAFGLMEKRSMAWPDGSHYDVSTLGVLHEDDFIPLAAAWQLGPALQEFICNNALRVKPVVREAWQNFRRNELGSKSPEEIKDAFKAAIGGLTVDRVPAAHQADYPDFLADKDGGHAELQKVMESVLRTECAKLTTS